MKKAKTGIPLLDTHALLWCLRDSEELSGLARRTIDNAAGTWKGVATGWFATARDLNAKSPGGCPRRCVMITMDRQNFPGMPSRNRTYGGIYFYVANP